MTVVPLCGGFWTTGLEREPYRRVADALGAQARGLMAPGLVDDADDQAGADRPCRRSGDLRTVGAARRRAVRDRGPGVDRRAGRGRDRRPAPGVRGGRRGPRRAVRHRWPLRVRRTPRAGHRSRCPPAGPVPVAIGVASGESKVRPILGALRAGVVRTLVTDVATAEAVVALDEVTLAPAGGRPR